MILQSVKRFKITNIFYEKSGRNAIAISPLPLSQGEKRLMTLSLNSLREFEMMLNSRALQCVLINQNLRILVTVRSNRESRFVSRFLLKSRFFDLNTIFVSGSHPSASVCYIVNNNFYKITFRIVENFYFERMFIVKVNDIQPLINCL